MGQTKYEQDRNRFNLSERIIVEMFLLSYFFIFFLGEVGTAMPYIWLIISIIGGVISFFVFYNRDYSLGFGVGLAIVITAPLLLMNAPFMNVLLFFVYVLWRIQSNFNGSRIQGWPFLTVNTLVFVVMYFLARLLFAVNSPEELMRQQIYLYLLTSFLYFFIRMVSITVNSRQLGNFRVREAGRIFGYIVGLGSLMFVVVFLSLDPVRRAIIGVFSFLFAGVFTVFGKAMEPIIDFLNKGGERIEEKMAEEESGYVDFEMKEELNTYGNTSSIFEYTTLAVAIVILVIIAVILVRKKGKKREVDKMENYSFSFKGKKEKPEEQRRLLYDYSSARDEVRKSFEQFEKEAQTYNYSRMHGETVKEWFSRMGWMQKDLVLALYNDVRYGSRTPSEVEHSMFIQELEEIKKTFSKKEV